MTADVETLARVIARHGLPGTTLMPLDRPLSASTWDALLDVIRRERLWALLASAIAEGAMPASDDQAHVANERHVMFLALALRLEATLLRVTELLATRGVGTRVLKGLAVAHLDYPDPALRCSADVDLLVRSEQLEMALEAMQAAGWTRDLPERRPGFDHRFGKEVTLYTERGVEIDVHRTLALGPFGLTIELDDLWEEPTPYDVGGATLEALSPQGRFLHACYTTAIGDRVPRLVTMRDLAQLLLVTGVDWRAAVRMAAHWRGEAVVAAALDTCGRVLGVDHEAIDWARQRVPSSQERRWLRSYPAHGGSHTRALLVGAAPLRGFERFTYLGALVAPDLRYVRARRIAARPSEWRRGLRELLPGHPGGDRAADKR